MLVRLFIKDFALIRELEIEFSSDLNVFTGETGAGKSIILGALNSILGWPARADMVRDGADRCAVEGLFELSADSDLIGSLSEWGICASDNQLTLRREITSSGRSRAFVNDFSVPLRRLRKIGTSLVDVYGQHEHQSLLQINQHSRYLDAFGGLSLQAAAVGDLFRQHGANKAALEELHQKRIRDEEAQELRRFQLDEIRTADLQAGEDIVLERELVVLENGERIRQVTQQLVDALYQSDGSIVEQLGRLRKELEQVSALDQLLNMHAEGLRGLIYGVEELSSDILSYAENLGDNPERIAQVRNRLFVLRQLADKYGGSLHKVIAFATELEVGEVKMEELGENIAVMESVAGELCTCYAAACLELSQARSQAAADLVKLVEAGLKNLGAPMAIFEVRLGTRPDPEGLVKCDGITVHADEGGIERVEFYLSANPGEAPKPLANVGSGGELSRVMLILRELIAAGDGVSTLVFDEIDTGISGRIAAAVGNKLKSLSSGHQVILITHLPQIASLADRHFSVRKLTEEGRMVTTVQVLDDDERTEEIAQLLAGEEVSESAREHAQQMLG